MTISHAQLPRLTSLLLIIFCLTFLVLPFNSEVSTAKTLPPVGAAKEEAKLSPDELYGKLPLSFEPNHGQTDPRFKFLARGSGHSLFLSGTEARLSLRKGDGPIQTLRMKVIGGNRSASVSGEAQLPGRTNYLKGNPDQWKTNLPMFGRVKVQNVYKGIDLVYYGSDQRHFEYDFVVSPGSDPKLIRVSFSGADKIHLDNEGNLHLTTDSGEVVQPAPYIYQEVDGTRHRINGKFVLLEKGEVRFEIGDYDRTRTLVIDPQLVYTTYFGGNGDDRGEDIAFDSVGNAYLVGSTLSTNLVTNPSLQGNQSGMDAFVVKVNPAGTQIVYATYLGSSGTDSAEGIAVMPDGRACVIGSTETDTNPEDFPLKHQYQGYLGSFFRGGLDIFVTVLTAAGSGVDYSTFLGGDDNDIGEAIALDPSGNIYITGETLSRNFPLKEEFQDENDFSAAFIAKINPRERGRDSLIYSSYLGGADGHDGGEDIAVTSAGVAFVSGYTESRSFPTRTASSLPVFQQNFAGGLQDGFVAKVSPAGQLIYSTYFGGDEIDLATGIAVDENERAYVTGLTTSSAASFPLKNAFDTTKDASSESFVAKFNADGTTLFYSSLITAGDLNNQASAIAIDGAGSAFITGSTNTRNLPFPQINGFPTSVPIGTTFIVKIGPSDATGTTVPEILFSDTVRAGAPSSIALDFRHNIYIGGTTSLGGIATAGAFQQSLAASNDGFLLKIASPQADTIGTFRSSSNAFFLRNSNTAGNADITTEFGQAGDLPIAGDWDGNGVTDVGVFRPSRGEFLLRVPQNGTTFSIITVNFGAPGDLPVAGDWNGDGIDSPGVFRPGSVGNYLLTNSVVNGSAPSPDIVFNFGVTGDVPVAGDWNGDGVDSIGVFRINAGAGEFHLSNDFENSTDIFFNFGGKGDLPFAGDWTAKGFDTVGVFRPGKSQMFLANNFLNSADIVFVFGQSGDRPVAGDWDGK